MDYIGTVTKKSFAKYFANARYDSALSDGSTDSVIIEQELVYMLYSLNADMPVMKYLSIESPENSETAGLKDYIIKVFPRFGTTKFSEHLLALNVDDANLNTSIHKGLGTKIKEEAAWLQLVHCFNHWLELVVKHAFDNSAFKAVEEFLNEISSIYKP